MKRRIKYFPAVIAGLLLGSCAMFRDPGTSVADMRKRSFDSTAYRTPSWRNFFGDSTLAGLIDTAIANNPDLQTAWQQIEIASAGLRARQLGLFPRVDAKAWAGQRRFGAYTMDGVGNYDTKFSPNISQDQIIPEHLPDFFVGLQSSWEIDIWKKLRNSREAARARMFQEVEGKNLVVSNLVASVASTYYELLSLDNELVILDDFIRLQENAEQIISYQKIAGQATELAVQQFKAQTLNSRNLRVETMQKIVQAQNRMSYLLGRLPGPIPRNLAAFEDSLQMLPEEIPLSLLKNRPDILQAEQAMREARLNVAIAEAAFYPALSLDALLGLQSFNPGFFFSPASITYNIVGALTAPLLNRASLNAALQVSGNRQRIALNNYRKTALTTYAEVSTEMAHLRNLKKMYAFKHAEAEASVKAVDIANSLFRTGRATYLEVIITQKNALLTKLQLVNLRERKLKSAISLYKALGGGWR